MRAAVVKEFGQGFTVEEVVVSAPGPREVLVTVRAAGLCHTDLTASKMDIGSPVPSVLGHELAGVVAGVGSKVTGLKIGDHVVGCLIQYCGACSRCLGGRVYQCLHPEQTMRAPHEDSRLSMNGSPITQGYGLGGFAQQALIHESQLIKIDQRMPFAPAALLGCGVVTGAGAVLNTAEVRAGDSVVVIGVGGVGLNAVNGAVIAGATTIIAIDISDEKLVKARRFGATHVINSTTVDPVDAVFSITGGGAHAVFDFVGAAEVSLQALAMAAVGGGLFLIGGVSPEVGFEIKNFAMVVTQKRIQGVLMGSTTPTVDIPMYVQLYLDGRLNLDELVSKEISLGEVNDGYEAVHSGGNIRVVITDFLR